MRILITGATGFVGRELASSLAKLPGLSICAATRNRSAEVSPAINWFFTDDSLTGPAWVDALKGVDVVIHLAARVHVMRDTVSDPISAFRLVNVDGTLSLARRAAEAGARRFIFLSSIKVNGEETIPGKPFRPEDPPFPVDAYGISKLEAELGLREMSTTSGMEVVIIRPPLIYGPGVKANFQLMMRWVQKGAPLPLGGIDNRRSLVAVENLVDLIVCCLDHPAAANQVFLACDGEDLSTPDLLRRLGTVLGKPARLIPIPVPLLRLMAGLVGKPDIIRRLCGSLQIDAAKTRELLGWQPPSSVDHALQRAANYYLSQLR